MYENPSMSDSDFDNEGSTDIQFYKPQVSIISKMMSVKSRVSLLDQVLLNTPPSSEEEREKEVVEITDEEPEVIEVKKIETRKVSAKCQESVKSKKEKFIKRKKLRQKRKVKNLIAIEVEDVLLKTNKRTKLCKSSNKIGKRVHRESTSSQQGSLSSDISNYLQKSPSIEILPNLYRPPSSGRSYNIRRSPSIGSSFNCQKSFSPGKSYSSRRFTSPDRSYSHHRSPSPGKSYSRRRLPSPPRSYSRRRSPSSCRSYNRRRSPSLNRSYSCRRSRSPGRSYSHRTSLSPVRSYRSRRSPSPDKSCGRPRSPSTGRSSNHCLSPSTSRSSDHRRLITSGRLSKRRRSTSIGRSSSCRKFPSTGRSSSRRKSPSTGRSSHHYRSPSISKSYKSYRSPSAGISPDRRCKEEDRRYEFKALRKILDDHGRSLEDRDRSSYRICRSITTKKLSYSRTFGEEIMKTKKLITYNDSDSDGNMKHNKVCNIESNIVCNIESNKVCNIELNEVDNKEPDAIGYLEPDAVGHLEPDAVGHLEPDAVGHLELGAVDHLEPEAVNHLESENGTIENVEPKENSTIDNVESINVGDTENIKPNKEIVENIESNKSKAIKQPEVCNKQEYISKKSSCNIPSKDQNILDGDDTSLDLSSKPEIKTEAVDCKGLILDTYYCKDCQLTLNSELTWQSHIRGKKHGKVLKAQAIHEIAKGSIAIPANPVFSIESIPRFANPSAGKKRVPVNEESKIQRTVEEMRRFPMPGLDRVLEIRSESEINYYCELCDAPCGPTSVMPHLIGFKHQLRCLKEVNPVYYESVKDHSKKTFERFMLKMLFDYEDKYGKGIIKVFKEVPDPQAQSNPVELLYFDRPGPSWGADIPIKKERLADGESANTPNDECLDTSKSDFYCTLCDSHMNNFNMWSAHVRGKRHLRNAKKIPGESISKSKAVKAPPNVVSKLELELDEKADSEVIVGLDYIKETQGKNGEIYNCFLCGSCSTNFDIVDHVLQTKHRIKYLEKLAADGKHNAISMISQMDINDTYFRENLIIEACSLMEEELGRGKVMVYISKNLPPGKTW